MDDARAIAFSSLLIGLLVGVHPVAVDIVPSLPAASLVVTLDGLPVARLTRPPWTVEVDFGEALRPHELVAIALDRSGREVGRVSRWVNTPQPPARVEILIERDEKGRPRSARMVATSVRRQAPVRRSLTLDSRKLDIDAAGQATLPKLDLTRVHVLRAVVDYSRDAIARAEIAFGGDVGDASGSVLTAVAVRLTGRKAPDISEIRDAFRGPSGPVVPVAIEKEGATVLLVRHPLHDEAHRRLGTANRDFPLRFDGGDEVGYVWPVSLAPEDGSVQSELFEIIGPFGEADPGYSWLLTHVRRVGDRSPPPYRFADAVAIAGLQACSAGRRRAVVLVEGEERRDASQLSPRQVEDYLASLGVPLRVWSLLRNSPTRWKDGQVEDVSSFPDLSNAVLRLKELLARQRIVWVSGAWAPGGVTLAPGVTAIELVR